MARPGVLKSLHHFFQRVFNRRHVGVDEMQTGALAQQPDGLTALAHHRRALSLQGFNLFVDTGEQGALRLGLFYRMPLGHLSPLMIFNAHSVARKTLSHYCDSG